LPHDPIAAALQEDIGTGDVTCRYFVDAGRMGQGRIVAREAAILAGIDAAAEVFHRVDADLEVFKELADGTALRPGEEVLRVKGRVRSILTAERVALNFLQRLSGVATLTRRYVDAIAGTGAVILDTRKTTPGLRLLEKAAVRAGGGTNHRIGLYDMVMVKDNHLAAEASREHLRAAIAAIREHQPDVRIELEADTLDQVRTYLELEGVSVILLDNMKLEELREAVRLDGGRVPLEASGGVNLETVRAIAETGVQSISVGALTHSAPAVDLSLELLE
jgi:nicotinate-nucleotide pyrophosphorylase (carboxylating)